MSTKEKKSSFIGWLENDFTPAIKKFNQRPWVAGFSEGVIKCIPFILTGSLIFFYNAIRSWLKFLPDLSFINTYTFLLLALIVAYNVVAQILTHLKLRSQSVIAGLTAICTHIMCAKGFTNESGNWEVSYGRFGPSAIVLAMLVALYVALVFSLVSKIHLFKKDSSVPKFIQEWVNNIIPIFLSILLMGILVVIYDVDILPAVLAIFNPIQNIAQSFIGTVLFGTLKTFTYTLGISGWTWSALGNAIMIPAQQANMAAIAAGEAPKFINVQEIQNGIGLISMGGNGATLAFNVLLLMSASKKLKTLGRVCIGPSLFNINEPLVFGAPVVMNPILMVPMILSTFVGTVLVWFIYKLGWMSYPNVALPNVGTLPVIANTVLLTGDFRGILWWVVLFAVYLAIWYPFFKVFEKQTLEEESKEEEN